jgi:hypothetical protein
VVGTATSGQAARTLGEEGELPESRTLASLLWRLEHDRLRLDDRTVVILDEVGMTEDVHLVALTARVEAAGAKLVLVGDPHQLGAVGPGGALGALVRRHPDVLRQLAENRRQHDGEERRALTELRDGSVGSAVAWYSSRGRLHSAVDREAVVQQAVDAWAADVAASFDTGLYAWRRANVAALNERARAWMQVTSRLSGPELVCPDGQRYRAGDRVVTLAPGADGRLVTSERAVVTDVDLSAATLTLRTADGQHLQLPGDEAGRDRLDYGYATTVHRGQGSTTERAHLFADGGGRELAYVTMSRARQSTHVWTVADDLPQAVDDLCRDWSNRRTTTWAIDTAPPDLGHLTRETFQALPSEHQARVAALLSGEKAIAGDAITGILLPDRAATLGQAEAALARARQARAELDTGTGVWQTSEAGQAVRDLAVARQARSRADLAAEPGGRWRDRRAARKEVALWAEREGDAQERCDTLVAPMVARLDQEIALQQLRLERAANRFEHRQDATRVVIDYGLQQQRHARGLGAASPPSATISTASRRPPRCARLPCERSDSKRSCRLPTSNRWRDAVRWTWRCER